MILVSQFDLPAAVPANDRFSNRITLSGTNLTVTGSNVQASKEAGEPDHAGNLGGQSVWWTWNSPTNGDVTITTDGSTHTDGSPLDTLLAVYTGTNVANLSLVASNDDHGVGVTSRVRFQAIKGTNYQIAVDGYNDSSGADSGNISLNLTFISEPILRPQNDNFANSTLLNGAAITTNGSNLMATREAGEPLHLDKLGDTSVWWSWTAPTTTSMVVSTIGSSFDTLLAIYVGSSVSNLILIASNDDIDPEDRILTSTAAFNAFAGQTYRIAVDGFDGASGQIVLRLAPFRRPILSGATRQIDGSFQFDVSGSAGQMYEIDSSSNLTSWTPMATLLNTNGSFHVIDLAAMNQVRQFYRAILAP